MALSRFGPPDKQQPVELPRPVPKAGEVLIQVHASSVNPVDWRIRSGSLRWTPGVDGMKLPRVLGVDVSGKVVSIGGDPVAMAEAGGRP